MAAQRPLERPPDGGVPARLTFRPTPLHMEKECGGSQVSRLEARPLSQRARMPTASSPPLSSNPLGMCPAGASASSNQVRLGRQPDCFARHNTTASRSPRAQKARIKELGGDHHNADAPTQVGARKNCGGGHCPRQARRGGGAGQRPPCPATHAHRDAIRLGATTPPHLIEQRAVCMEAIRRA